MSDTRNHKCDSGNFDRTICPEPCGRMHSYCDICGERQDSCAHDEPTDTRNHTTRDQLAEAIRESWHEGGFYGRADLAPGWLDGFATVTADALEPVIAAVRAAAVAETTAAIEALTPMVSDEWPTAGEWLSRPDVRAALSGGRTALDTLLAQARAELREQIARGIEDSRDRNQGNPAALAYLTHAAAIARHGRVEGADQ